jgi:ABC-type multidrug transport system permease subunit
MTAIVRIFLRDLRELAQSRFFLAVLLMVPLGLLLLIGQADVKPVLVRVAILAPGDEPARQQMHQWLDQISSATPVDWTGEEEQLAARALRERIDLVVVRSETGWQFFQATTHAWRDPPTRQVAQLLMVSVERDAIAGVRANELASIGRRLRWPAQTEDAEARKAMGPIAPSTDAVSTQASSESVDASAIDPTIPPAEASDPGAPIATPASTGSAVDASAAAQAGAPDTVDPGAVANAATDPLPGPLRQSVTLLETQIANEQDQAKRPAAAMGAVLDSRLTSLLGFRLSRTNALVPGYITLIGVFVSFVLASFALVRERESGTLPSLVIEARRDWSAVGLGKLLLPVLAGVILSAVLVVAARLVYGIGVKPGMPYAALTLLLAVSVSALVGLAVSAVLESSREAHAACAVYLVCLILLTGMVSPLEQASDIAIAVAHLFSFTVTAPAMEEWMAAGAPTPQLLHAWKVLGAQAGVALVLCAVALRRLRSRL